MHYITFSFTPLREPLNGHSVFAKGLHGLLFNITRQADREESDWLHKHSAPRPFSLVPLFDEDDCLVGIRFTAITDRVARLFQRTGEWFFKTGRTCHLGGREFIISDCRVVPGPSWQQLALSEPARNIGLRFVSPTSFKQGPGHLPLPLPFNVFGNSVRVWEAFAPPMMILPVEWLEWCKKDVFINELSIETVQINISLKEQFTGFVGEVWFQAHQGGDMELRTWNALSILATFCGVGHKTTMGMGVVELMT